MRRNRLDIIEKAVEQIPYVNIKEPFSGDVNIEGKVSVEFESLSEPLEFDVTIYPQYPFRTYDAETIRFNNKDYLEYNHVMGDGTICIHTSHNPDISKKLLIDFESLKNWIEKYYINKKSDLHYEHLITRESDFKGIVTSYMFTDVDYTFNPNQFGFVNLSLLSEGKNGKKPIHNYLTKGFADKFGKKIAICKWSKIYNQLARPNHGIFFYSEKQPATHNRFAYSNWEEFIDVFTGDFLEFLHQCEKEYIKKKRRGEYVPFYIGYNIPNGEVHWLVATLEIGNFPIEGTKENQIWTSKLLNENIKWATSRNSSYKYFFGRGAFSSKLTKKRILIIGVGAVGSNVARTLVKCGCTKIDLTDYDVKEPENVCRAEFQFASGRTDKIEEMSNVLSQISPFVNIHTVNQPYFEVISKALYGENKAKSELEDFLNSYDLIIDCSTDDDLMFVLDSLNLKSDHINLSITNHAKELVCAFNPNTYDFVTKQYSEILDNNIEDLYNPTGCSSPTFKASYNDISMLVQIALKKINDIYQSGSPKDNFIVKSDMDEGLNIKIIQY